MRLLVRLNTATWMMTDSVSATNNAPKIGSKRWVFVASASDESPAPSANEPVSPIKI